MRVLVVTTSYPSAHAPYNGIFVREHARALARRGHEVTVLAPRVFRDDPTRVADGAVTLRRFRFWSGQKLLVQYARVPVVRVATLLVSGTLATFAEARRMRADVIHAQWAIPSGLLAVWAAAILRVPVVVTVHRADLVMGLEGPRLARTLMGHALRRCADVIVVSEAQAEQVAKGFGVPADRVRVVPMGADTDLFAPRSRAKARADLGLADAPTVLFVGGLTQVKGVRELIAAFPSLRERVTGVRLLLAGDGPLREELETEAAGEAVQFLGSVAHEALPALMHAADVLVLPSHSEGLPVVLMEAAAAGLPVVATEVGGSGEVTALNPASRLIAPGDPEGIADALVGVLALGAPDVRRPDLASDDPYALDGSVRRVEAAYSDAIGRSARRARP